MLRLSELTRSFDGFVAVQSLNFELAAGEKHAVIGPNGAGKTTMFNLITGQLQPDFGDIYFEDRVITHKSPVAVVRLGLARSFQRINIFPRLTVFENVQSAHIAHHRRHFHIFASGAELYRTEAMADLEAVGLEEEADTLAGLLAYGKQKQLELAITLASEPRLLLLDEPTAGMSAQETADIIGLVDRIVSARQLTLLFTEHDMKVVFRIADRISVLHHGELIASGTPDAVRADMDVQRVYLGGTG